MSGVGFTTQWRGQPDTLRRRLFGLILASALLHLPVSPLILVLAAFGLFALREQAPSAPLESLNAIPVELLETGDEPPAEEASDPSDMQVVEDVTDEPSEPVAAPAPELEDAGVEDAGVEDADPADLDDAGLDADPDADLDGAADAEPDADVDPDADSDPGSPGPTIRDPVALAAEKAKVVDSNAHVTLTVYAENVRRHPLGLRVGRVMALLPQWQDFFGPSGIDPVRDIDRIMLVGNDFRDTSRLAVLVQHSLPNAKIYSAVDALVKRRKSGRWLEGTPLPAALGYADRAERVFVIPSSYLVIIAPLSAKDSALSVPRSLRIPAPEGDEALVGLLRQPGYAFQKHGAPLTIPPTIESLKYWISPLPNGGGRLRFVARDASPEEAQRSLRSLQDQIDQLRAAGAVAGLGAFAFKDQLARLGLTQKDVALFLAIVNRLSMSVHGNEIHGTLDGSQALAESVIERVEQQFGMTPTPAQ